MPYLLRLRPLAQAFLPRTGICGAIMQELLLSARGRWEDRGAAFICVAPARFAPVGNRIRICTRELWGPQRCYRWRRPASSASWRTLARVPLVAHARGGRQKEPTEDSGASEEEWESLILEFERRAMSDSGRDFTAPLGQRVGRENPAQYESLPIVETAFMSALTTAMWYFGRIFRLDAFIMLFYPVPMLYAAMRWGPSYGDRTLIASLFLIFTLMGPLYCVLFFLNTGLLGLTFTRAFWYQWPPAAALLAGAIAKCTGLVLQLSMTSKILRYDAWQIITHQVKGLIDGVVGLVSKLVGQPGAAAGIPLQRVQVVVAVVLGLHSAYHVLFTHMTSSMILERASTVNSLKRTPILIAPLRWFRDRVNAYHAQQRSHRR